MSSIIPGIIACGSRNQIYVGGNCDNHWDETVLAIHMDSDFSDEKGHVPTVYGSSSISSTHKFGGGSGYFDGSAFGSVNYYDSDDFKITGDFTIDCWIQLDTSLTTTDCILVSLHYPGSSSSLFALKATVGATPDSYSVGCLTCVAAPQSYSTFTHILLSREGGTTRLFINGVLSATSVLPIGLPVDTTMVSIGSFRSTSSGGGYTKGYIDELRITKGVARYTADFPVLTAPFDTVQCGPGPGVPCDDYWDDVVLAMPFSLTTQYTDLKGHEFSTSGVSAPTTGGPFGDGFISFLGTSSRIYSSGVTSFEDLKTGSSDFAFQVFISHDPTGGDVDGIIYRSSPVNPEIDIRLHRDTGIITATFNGGAQLISVDALAPNTFTFLHVERNGDTFSLYLDNVLQDTDTYSGSIASLESIFPTMGNDASGAYDAKIKLCNLRFTIGVTRSPAVPTAPFAESCYVPISSVPAFTSTGKVTIGPTPSTPPSYLPTPTPTPTSLLSTGAGGRMLEVIGGSGFHVMDNDLVKFDTSTLTVSTKVQNFGACDPTYTSGGVLIGCSNTDHSIHSTCSDGTNIYVSAYKDLRKFDSSLNSLVTVSPTVTYEHLCYASSFLWGVVGTTVYKINPTTLLPVSSFTVTSSDSSLLLETDGTNLFVLRMVNSTTAELMKHTVASSTTTSLYSGLDRRSPIVVGSYVYVGSDKVHTSTGAVTALSFDLNTSPYLSNDANWSVSGTLIATLKFSNPATWKQEILIVDTSDDSIVDTITDFQEVISCTSGNIYAFCQGIGLLSSTKLIVSNGKTACYNYSGGLGYAGYSVYELT